MSPLTYRRAVLADLPFIIGLSVENRVVSSGDDPGNAMDEDYVQALAAIDADLNQELVVVEEDGEPVGTFQLTFIPGLMRRGIPRGLIEGVFVRADRRGAGIGSQMMGWAIARCRERGCGIVQLTSNKQRTDAHRFYERLGFKRSHEGFKYYL